MEAYTIRQAESVDVKFYVEWALAEGWNMSPDDGNIFFKYFPQGWFIAQLEENGEKTPVAKLHCTKYSSNIGFIGYLIVKKEYRRKGYGYLLVKHSLDNFLDKEPSSVAVGLYSAAEEIPYYNKFGFEVHNQIHKMKVLLNGAVFDTESTINPKGIVLSFMDTERKDLEDVSKMDKLLSGAYRPGFWSTWGSKFPKEHCVLCRDENSGELIGMGALRPLTKGSKLGPLYANNETTARNIINRLLSNFVGEIRADVTESTEGSVTLFKQLGFVQFLNAYLMWRGNPSQIISPGKNVYCVTSLSFN